MSNISGKKQRDHDEPNGARTAPSLGNERPGLIFESAPVMMHSIDREGRIVAVNREWLKRLGYERDEVLGKKSIDFLADTSRARAVTDTLPLFWRTGSARSVGYRFLSKTGDLVDLVLVAVACPPTMGSCTTFAALYEPEDLVQWRAASVTLQNLLQLALEQEKLARGGPAQEGSSTQRSAVPEPLSPRELEVLSLMSDGFSNSTIAEQLSISLNTVLTHTKHINMKLDVHSRTQASARANELNLL